MHNFVDGWLAAMPIGDFITICLNLLKDGGKWQEVAAALAVAGGWCVCVCANRLTQNASMCSACKLLPARTGGQTPFVILHVMREHAKIKFM